MTTIEIRSRPIRARGLKLELGVTAVREPQVAPHTGAWIETPEIQPERRDGESRPIRARGLKLHICVAPAQPNRSRPIRARGLKLPGQPGLYILAGRAPYGRVD